jgi:restriction system protein
MVEHVLTEGGTRVAIPDYQTVMLPLLSYTSDQQEHSTREAIDSLATQFRLSDAEREELLPSGQQSVFDNRVNWAASYLRHAGLLERTRRGCFRITDRGDQLLRQNPQRIDVKLLAQYPEFNEFKAGSRKERTNGHQPVEIVEPTTQQQTPEEMLEFGYQRIRQELAQELLSRIKTCSPSFFERLVVELLVKMGYGGSRKDAGEAVGRSGDEGIDGIIKEDRLGLDTIYIQAKRWQGTVGRPEIHRFAGALLGQRARKGIFISTSEFSRDARDYAGNIDSKIVLIDGEQLAQLMIDHDVGVARASLYEIKRIDSDYFSEV